MTNGADVNHKSRISGDMAIFTALQIRKFDYGNYFLDKGTDPTFIDYNGNSLPFLIQEIIKEGRLSDYGLKECIKLIG